MLYRPLDISIHFDFFFTTFVWSGKSCQFHISHFSVKKKLRSDLIIVDKTNQLENRRYHFITTIKFKLLLTISDIKKRSTEKNRERQKKKERKKLLAYFFCKDFTAVINFSNGVSSTTFAGQAIAISVSLKSQLRINSLI